MTTATLAGTRSHRITRPLQYIALASVGAYCTLYRGHAAEGARAADAVAVRPMEAKAG